MSDTMMGLGAYRFSIDSAAYQEIKRSQAFRWQAQERLLRRPAMQYIGLGEESIELNGLIYPHYRGGLQQVDSMKAEAKTGRPLLLVDGLGFVWGEWVIAHINESQSFFMPAGLPLKHSFSLRLLNYGADSQ